MNLTVSPHSPEENSNTNPTPIGFNPEGWPIACADKLPTLPIPTSVEVSNRHISIDGWNFPYALIKKPMLTWFRESMLRWMKKDSSAENTLRITAIASTFQKGLKREISNGEEYPTIQL
jgi:hypothetical protein